ncbi:MAG: exo-alpha-sialidase [Thermoplasmata archaeon]|nr:exo-alpha-sialidase [Thermoplasmata archaeon]
MRRFRVTRTAFIVSALLLSYFLLPATEILEEAKTIQFSRPNVSVDADPARSALPRIATDGAGVLHAVWTDTRFGDRNIACTKSVDNGTTWTTPKNISKAFAGFYSENPSIAIDDGAGSFSGSIYVVYETAIPGGDKDMYVSFSRDGGTTWVESIRVDHESPGDVSSGPSIAINSDGAIFVAWHDTRVPGNFFHIFSAKSTDGGLTWLGDYRVSQSFLVNAFPAVATRQNSDAYIAWQEYGRYPEQAVTGPNGATPRQAPPVSP